MADWSQRFGGQVLASVTTVWRTDLYGRITKCLVRRREILRPRPDAQGETVETPSIADYSQLHTFTLHTGCRTMETAGSVLVP